MAPLPLDQLAPNVPASEPSLWPLALGYWLVLAVIIVFIAGSLYFIQQRRDWWRFKAELNRLQQLPSANQLSQLHQMLRWAAIHWLKASPALTEKQFEKLLQPYWPQQQAAWLNRHYQPRQQTSIDWPEVQRLTKNMFVARRLK